MWALSPSFPVFATSCQPSPIIVGGFYNFDKAHVVFVGTVIDIYNPHPDIHPGTEEYDMITFDVIRVLKGEIDDGTVRTEHGSSGYNQFKVGESYLVYAFGGIRDVSQCTPPILLDDPLSPTIHEITKHYVLPSFIGIIFLITLAIVVRKRR